MVTVISRFRVRNGMEEEVRQAFLDRPRLVEKATGFCGLDVLIDAADPSVFLLLTRWTDEESFRIWHRSESHHASHVLIPKGLKLDPAFTLVTIGHSIQIPAPVQTLRDAIATQADAVSGWLANSETVFALLLSPDGTIRERNQAAQRIFPVNLTGSADPMVQDYLLCSDTEHLQNMLSKSESEHDTSFLLNLAEREQSPVTWEARLLRFDGGFLLFGTEAKLHDTLFQDETLRLTNDLSIAVREAAQKNRELRKANESVEILARTDGLTGLANRRMLEEILPRDATRANRLNESLSMIFVDVDNFKPINDQFGHKAGDQVLVHLGTIFKNKIRSYALAARFGGDEFVLLLPGTTKEGAIVIAERIREMVGALALPECPRRIAVSMGIATFMTGETGGELMARADEALYRAKGNGGNRFEVA